MTDLFNLQRFVDAQAPVYDAVVRELAAGEKRSHWMWFVFPQIAGLGFSPTSVFFAIASLDEARAYLAHPALGPRLRLRRARPRREGPNGASDFGPVDEAKFRSSMTLFSRAAPELRRSGSASKTYFDGVPDLSTLGTTMKLTCLTPCLAAAERALAPRAGASTGMS